jgi:hypothetical protein
VKAHERVLLKAEALGMKWGSVLACGLGLWLEESRVSGLAIVLDRLMVCVLEMKLASKW